MSDHPDLSALFKRMVLPRDAWPDPPPDWHLEVDTTPLIDDAAPRRQGGYWLPFSRSIMRDMGMGYDPTPWLDPDRNPFPRIDPVPAYTAVVARYRWTRRRIVETWATLRHGLPDEDAW